MASTVPFSQVVNAVPSVLSAGGDALDLNTVFLTQNASAPYGSVLDFASQPAVADYFGATSTEATLASNYFRGYTNGTKLPGALYITRYPETAIAGFLQSGSLASMTLTQLQALTGTLSITVAGAALTSASINLSGATSFTAAAALIEAGFTSPPFSVAYSSTSNAFVFTTTATGAAETITYATGTLSTSLNLTQATGAVLSQGAGVATPAAFMDSLIDQSQNFVTFMTVWEAELSEKEAFAQWSNSQGVRFLYVAQDSDIGALTANNTTTFGNYLTTNALIGTLPVWGPDNTTNNEYAAFICGFAASLNFGRLNGRATLKFKSQSGLTAAVTTLSDYTAVTSNGYNVYTYFGSNNPANNQNWMTPGSVSGEWAWADTYLNAIWLNANLQLALVTLLTSVGSLPYNSAGYALIRAAAMDPINDALNFGAIRTGVSLSDSQIAEIQYLLGFDASSTITKQGYYLQIVDPSATVRAARGTPSMTLLYADGESIQSLSLASIAIQ